MIQELRQDERAQLFRELASDDEEQRRQAALRLHLLPPAEAAARWVACLGDAAWRVRKVAAEQLAARADDSGVLAALIEALADGENPGRRNSAAEALIRSGARAVPALIAALSAPDSDLRKLAVDALARIDDARAQAPLVAALDDEDPNVRAAAAEALGSVGGSGAVRALLGAVERVAEDPLVQQSALLALDALGASAGADLLDSALADPLLRPAALALLARSEDPQSRKLLIDALSDRSRAAREAAMRALLARAAQEDEGGFALLRDELRAALACGGAVAEACARLATADLPTQLVLVQFLGLAGDVAALRPLLAAAQDEALTELCAGALAALGDPLAAALAESWEDLPPASRAVACRALAQGSGSTGDALLLRALDAPDPELRQAAARACGARQLDAALPALVAAIERAAARESQGPDDENAALTQALAALVSGRGALAARAAALLRERIRAARGAVRGALAHSWCQLAGSDDAETAALLLRDPESELRAAAALATARIGGSASEDLLRLAAADEVAEVRSAAARALAEAPPSGLPEVLLALAHDEAPVVRATALRSVGERLRGALAPAPREAALAAVAAALGGSVPVALAAAEALRAVGGEALRAGRVLLESPEAELVCEGIRCVSDSGDPATLASLVALIAHADWSVRAEALEVLSRHRVTRSLPAMLSRLEFEQDSFVRDVLLRAIRRLEA